MARVPVAELAAASVDPQLAVGVVVHVVPADGVSENRYEFSPGPGSLT
ncbi:MAG: hypothetical protein WB948_10645 [Desulfobaccales bacterium]